MAAYYFLASDRVGNRSANLEPAIKFFTKKEPTTSKMPLPIASETNLAHDLSPPEVQQDMSQGSLFTYNPEGYDTKITLHLTPYETQLIRSSWNEMIQDEDDHGNPTQTSINSIAATLFCVQFYANLIAMSPEVEKMFPSIKHQAISLSGVISTAIANLDHLEKLEDYLSNLGKRHSRILGIEPEHFELMGIAMLKTFKDRFGARFTLDLEKCWSRLFTYLSNQLLQMGIDPIMRLGVNYHTIQPKSRSLEEKSMNSTFTGTDNATINSNGTRSSSVTSIETDHSDVKSTFSRQQSTLSQMRNGSIVSNSSHSPKANNHVHTPPPSILGRTNHLNKGSNKKKNNNNTTVGNDNISVRSNGSTDEKCSIM